MLRKLTFLIAVTVLVSACAPIPANRPATATLRGDAAHPAAAQGWLRTELYFGVGVVDDPTRQASDAAWREFLDREVSPRFPDGLSVTDIYGQWRDKGAAQPERLNSKVIMLLHPDTADARARIDAIRSAWKKQSGDQSVLRVTQPAEVSF